MKRYDPKSIEPKWQQIWADTKLYAAVDGDRTRDKFYMLTEFPYPSGAGLHAGHAREYTLGDVIARYKRMLGYNVLYPMGYDAFGLPTENYAIKNKMRPQDATAANVEVFHKQLVSLGLGVDWDREINTTDPEYYRWTQWLFLKFYEAGLAYQAEMPINWCPKEKTGLANEEVVNGLHERCGTPVEKKLLKQWMLRITDYADRLIEGLKGLDFPPQIADQQINWIGRSEGAEIEFGVSDEGAAAGGFKRVVLMHGKTATPNDKWYPWFGKQVEAAGLEYIAPELGTDKSPMIADWTAKLEATKPDEQTIIVGHSRGAMAILRWLERADSDVRVGRVVLIGANEGADAGRSDEGGFYGENYDFAKIKSHCSDFVVIHSRDDYQVPFAAGENVAAGLGVELSAFEDKGHFARDTREVPEVLDLVLGNGAEKITVYTTRPDTLAGATFLVLAPEHPTVARIATDEQRAAVEAYVKQAQGETDVDRQNTDREKTGVWTGATAKNPISGREMPIWVADYVLNSYGTGAIMAVPAHDERDFAFARKFDLPVVTVVAQDFGEPLEDTKDVEGVSIIGYDPETKLFMSIKRPDGMAWLAGGGREGDESFEDTARRELSEETGHSKIAKLIELGSPVYSYYYNDLKKSNRRSFAHNYLAIVDARHQGDHAQEAHEDFTVAWSDFDQLYSDIKQTGGGVEHWLEALCRARDAAAAYDLGEEYEAPIYSGSGPLINSGQFDGLSGVEAKRAIVKWLFDQGLGKGSTKFRLRDWIFSRQHYWGEPIPIVHCAKCGVVPVPEDQLPITLPDVDNYEPTDTGESPLAAIENWVNTTCPKCGEPAKRETDTMPNWAGSSWYWLRYMDARNDRAFADRDKLDYWGAADLYIGGPEHTTLHLLYSRFWHEFLYDQGLVPTPEPFARRRSQGIVLAADGRKMSKSWGNVVNPTDIIEKYGADALRLYILFMAPYDETTAWSEERLNGVSRFVWRAWGLCQELLEGRTEAVDVDPAAASQENTGAFDAEVDRMVHKTIKKLHDDLHDMKFNTSISALMALVNFLASASVKSRLLLPENTALARRSVRSLVLMLAPFTPHMAEELWREEFGEEQSVHVAGWPKYDEKLIEDEFVTIVVQVNGKVRGKVLATPATTDDELARLAKADANVAAHLDGAQIIKTVVVPRRIVNFVVKVAE